MQNELEVKKDTALATNHTMADMPEFQPMENQDTVRLPRLVLIQEKRPEIKDGLAKAGDLLNSLSKENYGDAVEIIPIVQMVSSRIRWRPRNAGGGIMCVSRDGITGQGTPGGACASCAFYSVRKGKDQADDKWCAMSYQIIALVRATREPIMLMADSIRPSDAGVRDMLGMARMAANKGVRLFHKSYLLKSVQAKNPMGEFFKVQCVPGNNNQILPPDEIKFLADQMEFFRVAKMSVDEEHGEGKAGEF